MADGSARAPRTVSAIVPARNAAATLEDNLAALKAQSHGLLELIVFDDGSSDDTATIARRAGAKVLRHEGAAVGPARGRNAGAAGARGDLLFFVDSDVVLGEDALERLVADLVGNDAAAAFGSYDDRPPVRRATSLYANLRHHHVHQAGERDAATFWSGIGLIRREVFANFGGFNGRKYPRPSIEDIELGTRIIKAGGRIRLVPEAQGAHWKNWSLLRVWHTDIICRAYPWSMLIAEDGGAMGKLNLSSGERAKALLAAATVPLLIAGLFWRPALLAAAAAALGYIILNRAFFGLLGRRAGLKGLLVGVAMHWCYHLYALATFALVAVVTRLRPRPRAAEPAS